MRPVFPSLVSSAPDDYPPPTPGRPVTRWSLRTPEGEPVGVLTFNDGGVEWAFASTEDESAQEHGAEVLQYLRGNRAEGVALADVLDGVRRAYEGDLDES